MFRNNGCSELAMQAWKPSDQTVILNTQTQEIRQSDPSHVYCLYLFSLFFSLRGFFSSRAFVSTATGHETSGCAAGVNMRHSWRTQPDSLPDVSGFQPPLPALNGWQRLHRGTAQKAFLAHPSRCERSKEMLAGLFLFSELKG